MMMSLSSSFSLSVIPTTSFKSMNHVVIGRNQLKTTTTTKCSSTTNNNNCQNNNSFFLNLPSDDIFNKAFKEPVAFMGGMFAGLLRLDLNEDPLKEWVTRTVEASGFTDDEIITPEEQVPQQIEID